MLQYIDTGEQLSQAVVHNDTVYLSGQVAVGVNIEQQTKAVLGQIDDLLARAGTDKSYLLNVTIWMTDISDFTSMNAIWRDWLGSGAAPARASCQVQLAVSEYLIEICAIAALPGYKNGKTGMSV